MSQAQTRHAIASLSQSLFVMFQQLGFTESKLDSIQASLDDLVGIANDKTKDAVQEVVVSVDKDRKERRKKDGKGKDKDKKEDVVVEQQQPATEIIAKSAKPKRNNKRSSDDK